MSAIGARQHPNTVWQISICFLFYSIICQVAKLTIIHIVQSYCCCCWCCSAAQAGAVVVVDIVAHRRCCHTHCLFSRVSTHFSCNRSQSVYIFYINETNEAQENCKTKNKKKTKTKTKTKGKKAAETRQQATWLSFEYLLVLSRLRASMRWVCVCVCISVCVVKHVERKLHFLCSVCCRLWTHFMSICTPICTT